jgi:hypothetical protein
MIKSYKMLRQNPSAFANELTAKRISLRVKLL